MIVIGLAGGIATGKGVVARTWAAEPGVEVVDADQVVHELYRRGSPVYRGLIRAFGPEILDSEGRVDRQQLGALAFGDPAARRRLNALVHPAVRARYRALARAAARRGVRVFVVEAALLLDDRPDGSFFDALVLTEVAPPEQLRRLMARDGIDRQEALRKVRAQRSQAARRRRADFVLDTSGPLRATQARARALLRELCRRFA